MTARYVTTSEAAEQTGVSVLTLRKWARAGLVQPAKRTLAGHLRWDIDDLQRQLRERWPDDYGGELGGRGPLA